MLLAACGLAAVAPPVAAGETVITVLGDSLTAGFGLLPEDAFPAQLEARLQRDGLAVRVVNAGVSGDTSAGGRARLDWVLADAPDMVIVELGANDALRGLAPSETEANLDAVLAALAMGAQGIWLGTRFIVTDEARGHINYKNKIVEINEEDTIVSKGHSGKTCRLIRNDFTAYWEAHAAEIKPYPQQLVEVGEPATILGRIEGDADRGVLPAGQSSGLITGVKGAGSVGGDIVTEARQVLSGLAALEVA